MKAVEGGRRQGRRRRTARALARRGRARGRLRRPRGPPRLAPPSATAASSRPASRPRAARSPRRTRPSRKAAYEELLALGAPAKDAAAKALRARREAAVAEVAALEGVHLGQDAPAAARRARGAPRRRARPHRGRRRLPVPVHGARAPGPEGGRPARRRRARGLGAPVRPRLLVGQGGRRRRSSSSPRSTTCSRRLEEGYVADLEGVKAAVNKAIDVPGLVRDDDATKTLAYNERVADDARRPRRRTTSAR